MAALAARAGLGMSDAAGWALREKQGAAEKMTSEKKKKNQNQEKNPGLNQLSALEAIGLGTPC